jgi:hypothetical protein
MEVMCSFKTSADFHSTAQKTELFVATTVRTSYPHLILIRISTVTQEAQTECHQSNRSISSYRNLIYDKWNIDLSNFYNLYFLFSYTISLHNLLTYVILTFLFFAPVQWMYVEEVLQKWENKVKVKLSL